MFGSRISVTYLFITPGKMFRPQCIHYIGPSEIIRVAPLQFPVTYRPNWLGNRWQYIYILIYIYMAIVLGAFAEQGLALDQKTRVLEMERLRFSVWNAG